MAKKSSSNQDNSKICAVLSYLLIGIIWYFADEKIRKNSFVKFHVKQAIVLLIAWIIYSVVLGALFVPIIALSFGTLGFLMYLLNLLPWIFVIIGIINAANNKESELPIIGGLAKNFNF